MTINGSDTTDTDLFNSPFVSRDANYGLLIERVSGKQDYQHLVSSGDAYQAMHVAMSLARPGEGDVLIVTWTNQAGEDREFSVKVLVRK